MPKIEASFSYQTGNGISYHVPLRGFSTLGGTGIPINLESATDENVVHEMNQALKSQSIAVFIPAHEFMDLGADLMALMESKLAVTFHLTTQAIGVSGEARVERVQVAGQFGFFHTASGQLMVQLAISNARLEQATPPQYGAHFPALWEGGYRGLHHGAHGRHHGHRAHSHHHHHGHKGRH